MADIFTPDEIRQRYGSLPYITPYERIVALVDEKARLVELHEFHARGRCSGGAAWEVHHYARTSPLVVSARREGARNIFVCREGTSELALRPGIAGAGLEEVRIDGGEVAITYAGLAGGGVAATLCRGMADGVISAEVHEAGGGATLGRATLRVPAFARLAIGADDTDDAERGATWSTMNEIAYELESEEGCRYLLHTIAQLYPENPHRTTNCCATAVVLGAPPEKAGMLVERVRGMLADRSFSDECGMAVTRAVSVAEEVRSFAREARRRMVSAEEAQEAAGDSVQLLPVTGERGCIGALAAVGFCDLVDEAVRLPEDVEPL